MSAAPDQFVALITEFAQSVGLQGEPDALGVEFVAGERSVLVLPHPGDATRLVAEVFVGPLDAGPGDAEERLRLLHRINEAARFEHDWSITLAQDDTVLVYTIREIARTSAADLQGVLADGIDRAEALMTLLVGQSDALGADASDPAAGAGIPNPASPSYGGGGFIRG